MTTNLTLHAFVLDVPAGWEVQQDAETATLLPPVSQAPAVATRTNVVLRELTTSDTLPAIARATALDLHRQIAGAHVFEAEPTSHDRVVGRRVWAVAPGLDARGVGCDVMMVRDLLLVDGVLLEATSTFDPLVAPEEREAVLAAVDSARPLPLAERTPTQLRLDPVAPEVLDTAASGAAGVPLEDLTPLDGAQQLQVDSGVTVSRAALAALTRLTRGLLARRADLGSEVGRELVAAGLVDATGRPNDVAEVITTMQKRGRLVTGESGGAGRHDLRLWGVGRELLVEVPAPAGVTLTVVTASQLVRVLMAWSGVAPGWGLGATLEVTEAELVRKLEGGHIGSARGRAADLLAETPWRYHSVQGEDRSMGQAWITTRGMGAFPVDRVGGDAYRVGGADVPLWYSLLVAVSSATGA